MTQYSKSFLIDLYRKMLEIRLCEESLVEPILNGQVKCPVHLCSGEEAVSVGVCAALEEVDYIFGNHRSHGHFIAKGGKINELVAEIYGKETGCSRGRGGSMHLIAPAVGMLGSAPIVAGTISLAVGAALAFHIRNEKRVSVSFFGDGATNEGVLFESMNFAALKELPVIFVCENNLYATHMPVAECRPNCDIVEIARPFGITSACVDGNDVLEVYETAAKAVELCKSGRGPFFMEALTYRFRGHVGPDDNIQGTHTDIRRQEEIEMWKKKDPIDSFEKWLMEDGILNDLRISEIKSHVHRTVQNAHAFSNQSPYPKESELNAYVFKQ
jgi:acetoin:2,6-dichlorophenolindophenol oxidoreductase subunit alpha